MTRKQTTLDFHQSQLLLPADNLSRRVGSELCACGILSEVQSVVLSTKLTTLVDGESESIGHIGLPSKT